MDRLQVPSLEQSTLIGAVARLLSAEGHAVEQFETHLSWILVAGGLAYKFKKAVHLDFVDYSTLEARRFCCSEELRLNRRFSPRLYIDVVAISMEHGDACIGGTGPALEYALRMRAFDQGDLWSRRVRAARLGVDEIDQLAGLLAEIHSAAAPAPEASDWGSMEAVAATADETLGGLARLCGQLRDRALLTPAQLHQAEESVSIVAEWGRARRCTVGAMVEKRKASGRVRECHGDLHLRNILTTRQGVQLFDCVEFAPSLRWIDVMNDIAFVIMDLCFNGQEALAARLLNGYLEKTGDYAGLAVLPYYLVHRALVRGEVALLRAIEQADEGLQFDETLAEGLAYLALANRLTRAHRGAAVMIMHGYPGSGKSWFARNAVAVLGAVQLRSDVERKRLLGLRSTERGRPTLYTPAVTEMTYRRLVDLADMIVAAGWPVIVDAAFLQGWQRKLFSEIAVKSGVPFFILDMTASPVTLRRRLEERARQDTDASDADTQVLESQMANAEPLTEQEAAHLILIDMDCDMGTDAVADFCEPVRQAVSGTARTPCERSSAHACRQFQN